jgi:hypothetical protein
MRQFIVNGETYETDPETVSVLDSVKASTEAFAAVMFLGLKTGRIVRINEN